MKYIYMYQYQQKKEEGKGKERIDRRQKQMEKQIINKDGYFSFVYLSRCLHVKSHRGTQKNLLEYTKFALFIQFHMHRMIYITYTTYLWKYIFNKSIKKFDLIWIFGISRKKNLRRYFSPWENKNH